MKFIENNQLKILSSYTSQLFYFSSCLLAFGINLPDSIVPKFLLLWILSYFFFIFFNLKKSKLFSRDNLSHVFLILFSIWSFSTYLFSENYVEAGNLIMRRISILLIPVFLLLQPNNQHRKSDFIFWFIIGNLFSIAWCLIQYQVEGSWGVNQIRFSNFSSSINQYKHYNYIGLNLSIGLIGFSQLFKNVEIRNRLTVTILSSIIYVVFIFLSRAKMSLFTIVVAMILSMVNLFKVNNIKVLRFVGISIPLLTIICIFFYNSPNINLGSSVKRIDPERDIIWSKSILKINEKPLTGYGIGDSIVELREKSFLNRVNSHNQIFDFLMEGGAISFLFFFCGFTMIFFFNNYKEKKCFGAQAGVLFLLAFTTESVLNRIAGVATFIFIYFMLSTSINTKSSLSTLRIKLFRKLTNIGLLVILFLFLIICTLFISYKVDYRNPETYIGNNYTIINYNQLPKPLPNIFPDNTNAFKIDSLTDCDSWNMNAYLFVNLTYTNNQHMGSDTTSIYCYVTKDFNGHNVKLQSIGNYPNDISDSYNMTKKGTWQKLGISQSLLSLKTPIYLSVSKLNSESFINMTGYVIFAYPISL